MNFAKSTSEMTHQEWLEDRRKGIGGSDVATILGLNKYIIVISDYQVNNANFKNI